MQLYKVASACPLGPPGPEQGATLPAELMRAYKRPLRPEHFRKKLDKGGVKG